MIDVDEKKGKVIEIMKQKGPVLPVQVARELGLNSIFSSAILSEMISNKTIRLSSLKVGGSPLYYLEGQEALLENFSKFLGGKERETFELLKKNLVVQDDKMNPADRVAIRDIKDFAIPLKVNTEEGEKIFWKFHSLKNEEALKKINEFLKKRKPAKAEKEEKRIEKEKPEKIEKKHETKKEEKKEELKIESALFERIHSYLNENKLTNIQTKLQKKKEISMIVLAPSSIGKIEMLLIAKDKKTINEADLSLAASQGQSSKLPVLFLTTGKLTKPAEATIENFKHTLFFRQI
ncbi:hypothetical protein HZA33_02355 [Candidatus Pacearchaeota archaeon]|nr:hypothetical protein [Candidatus Pacearchaeota archaeon]